MKKEVIGAIVGGIIIFIWQFLSFALINFHLPVQQYTDKQDAILEALKAQNLPEGGYLMPSVPANASMEDHEKAMKASEGKPWASLQYHTAWQNNMVMNMVRGLVINIILVFLFCWLIKRMNAPGFNTILLSALFVGMIVFLNAHYTNFIWYETFDIWAHLGDAVVSWGLTGLWLGWWLRRNKKVAPERVL